MSALHTLDPLDTLDTYSRARVTLTPAACGEGWEVTHYSRWESVLTGSVAYEVSARVTCRTYSDARALYAGTLARLN